MEFDWSCIKPVNLYTMHSIAILNYNIEILNQDLNILNHFNSEVMVNKKFGIY